MKIKKGGNAGVALLICLLFVLVIAMATWMVLDKTNVIQNGTNNGTNNGGEVISNANLEAFNDMQTISIENLGKVYIDKTGNTIYYDPTYINSNWFSNLTVATPNIIHHGNYNPDPNSVANLSFNGYKLDLSNVQTAYGVRYGNGGANFSIIFVHKNGNISELNLNTTYSETANKTTITLIQNVSGYSNIVSVVQNTSIDGSSAILIDANGNLYQYFGINR